MNFLVGVKKSQEEILKNYFGKLLLITLTNYFLFWYHRIFITRYYYSDWSFKIIKFLGSMLGGFFFVVGVFTIVTIFIKREKVKKIIIDVFLILSLFFSLLEIFTFNVFNIIISNGSILLFLDTNINETKEFFSEYFSVKIIGIEIIFLIFCYFLNKVRLKKIKFIGIILFLSFSQIIMFKNNIKPTYFFRIIRGVKDGIENRKMFEELSKKINSNINIIENNSDMQNIVLVIGESLTRNHMEIYGYEKNNNPFLKKLKERGDLFVFTDVISSQGTTINSVKKILTFYNYEKSGEWYNYNNIIDIMRKAGYKTYWFSNQEAGGEFANIIVSIARRSDIILFNDSRDTVETYGKFDGQIVEKSKNYIEDENKKFIVYHIIGSHAVYKNRYPESFEKFAEKDYVNKVNLDEKQKKKIAEYDNSVLYNDYVLNEIIDLYKNKNAIIIYLSDHAEELFDNGKYNGHGENVSRYILEIPFMIYVGEKFKKLHPELIKKIKDAQNRKYMSDDLINTILDISKIKTSDYEESRSVINNKYDENRKRIVNGKDYDIELKK